jgi:hypothetical protein
MKWLVLAVFILAQQPTKAQESKGTAKPNGAQIANQADAAESQQKPSPPARVAPQPANTPVIPKDQVSVVADDSQRNEAERRAHEGDLKIQRKIVWFTGLLVFVGFVQSAVMVLQWLMYRRQARIMTDQITTTRDTERAWVIASPVDNAPVIGFISSGESNLERHLVGADRRNVFSCSFKTTGNSPARLVETAIRYYKVDRLEEIPNEPAYGERIALNDLPLVPGDSIGFIQFLEPSPILSRIESVRVTRQECFLYAFGIMVYADAYGRLHETRFGFVYHFPLGGDPRDKGFRREGLPKAYNQAT